MSHSQRGSLLKLLALLTAKIAATEIAVAEDSAPADQSLCESPETDRDTSPPAHQSCLLQIDQSRRHEPQKRAVVEIFYETKCPYSVEFLNKTLRHVWSDKKLRDSMDLKLYPFGNAAFLTKDMVSKGYHFWHPKAEYPLVICQHGEAECLGNLIHACAVDILQDSAKFVPFVMCMASYAVSTGVELSSYECGKQLGISMKKVKECANSQKGADLLKSLANATGTTSISHVPWVMVNGKHTKNDALVAPICDLYKGHGPRPKACPKLEDKSSEADEDNEHGGSGPCLFSKNEVLIRH